MSIQWSYLSPPFFHDALRRAIEAPCTKSTSQGRTFAKETIVTSEPPTRDLQSSSLSHNSVGHLKRPLIPRRLKLVHCRLLTRPYSRFFFALHSTSDTMTLIIKVRTYRVLHSFNGAPPYQFEPARLPHTFKQFILKLGGVLGCCNSGIVRNSRNAAAIS